jgi:hypothetical protein
MNPNKKATMMSKDQQVIKWLDREVSLYSTHKDNQGKPATYRNIIFCPLQKDIATICELREFEKEYEAGLIDHKYYKAERANIKSKLSCFTPAALLGCKATGQLIELNRTGVIQLDFDYKDINEYDVEELKQAVFNLPFIGYCGLSSSGTGFYALALIAEPARLSEYTEHCFEVLLKYGIKADTSKGKKAENLRYVSFDANMLWREDPKPLDLTHIKPKQAIKKATAITYTKKYYNGSSSLVNRELNTLQSVQPGERWQTVQRVAFTLGGLNDGSILETIKQAIQNNSSFAGEETKYLNCAEYCFNEGLLKPLNN